MTMTLDAIFENGILRPVEPIEGIREHSRVRISLESDSGSEHPLGAVIGTLSDEDADEMLRIIE